MHRFEEEKRALLTKYITERLKTVPGSKRQMILDNKLLFLGREQDSILYKPDSTIFFAPHGKQLPFLQEHNARILFLGGGNRSGKSICGGWRGIVRSGSGVCPFSGVEFSQPSEGRMVIPSYDLIDVNLIPFMKTWVPKRWLIGGDDPDRPYEDCWQKSYTKEHRILRYRKGSTIQFMSYDQEVGKFESRKLDWIWLDEESPENIFDANWARLIDTGGTLWITVTTLSKSAWMEDRIVDRSHYDPTIKCFNMEIWDNPYLSPEYIESTLKQYAPTERKAREKGLFLSATGKVYGEFDEKVHLIPRDSVKIEDGWPRFMACDPHDAQPFYYLWAAVAPDNQIYVYRELKGGEKHDIPTSASIIKSVEGDEFRKGWIFDRRIDPVQGGKRTATHGEVTFMGSFIEHDIAFQSGTKSLTVRHLALRNLLKYDTDIPVSKTNRPRIHIFNDLYGLTHDLRRANYSDIDDPKKYHLLNCLEWIACAKPYYTDRREIENWHPKEEKQEYI